MIASSMKYVLTHPYFLSVWGSLVAVSVMVLLRDLRRNNPQLGTLMKWVWGFTVLYSGPLGLAVYYYSGRRQIPGDNLWRRAFRSTAHCYSGCGAGEIVGVLLTVGLLGLGSYWVAGITFVLAYVAGFALTVGPLMEEGVPFAQAMRDALYSETASIAVMEIVAISVDLWLAGNAGMGDPIFWSSLVFSLSMGLIAAYPVNAVLVAKGVKAGMHSPAKA